MKGKRISFNSLPQAVKNLLPGKTSIHYGGIQQQLPRRTLDTTLVLWQLITHTQNTVPFANCIILIPLVCKAAKNYTKHPGVSFSQFSVQKEIVYY